MFQSERHIGGAEIMIPGKSRIMNFLLSAGTVGYLFRNKYNNNFYLEGIDLKPITESQEVIDYISRIVKYSKKMKGGKNGII
jgi:hypothetical protein